MNEPVVLCVIDGLRPDGLIQAHAPTISYMMKNGCSNLTAKTVMPSVTLPCHASLFLGVPPARHGILTNQWKIRNPFIRLLRPIPGLIEVLQKGKKSCAMFYNWEELRDVSQPGSLEASFFLKNCYDPEGSGDTILSQFAVDWLADHKYDFTFIYFGYVDVAGHANEWMSAEYLEAITNADLCLQRIMQVMPDNTRWIITSDHGGHMKTHGSNLKEDITIPIICYGPGIPAGMSMREDAYITDLAPTITHLFGIPAAKEWVGRSLLDVEKRLNLDDR